MDKISLSIKNGWMDMPSEEGLKEYLSFLRKEKIKGTEVIAFENFAQGVMDMYYQMRNCKKVLDK